MCFFFSKRWKMSGFKGAALRPVEPQTRGATKYLRQALAFVFFGQPLGFRKIVIAPIDSQVRLLHASIPTPCPRSLRRLRDSVHPVDAWASRHQRHRFTQSPCALIEYNPGTQSHRPHPQLFTQFLAHAPIAPFCAYSSPTAHLGLPSLSLSLSGCSYSLPIICFLNDCMGLSLSKSAPPVEVLPPGSINPPPAGIPWPGRHAAGRGDPHRPPPAARGPLPMPGGTLEGLRRQSEVGGGWEQSADIPSWAPFSLASTVLSVPLGFSATQIPLLRRWGQASF